MTPGDQARKIEEFINNFPTLVSSTFEIATRQLESDIHHRVFDEHLDINGNKLGSYSTKPMLVGKKSFVNKGEANDFFKGLKKDRKKEKGLIGDARKHGISFVNESTDSGWRTIDNHPLYLLMGGYRKLREIQGLQAGEIDLQYTHETELNGIITEFNNRYVVKFANKRARNIGRGLEERKGIKVFYPSEDEKTRALEFIKLKLLGGLKECFN